MIDALKLYDLFRKQFNLTEENAKEAAKAFEELNLDASEFPTKGDLEDTNHVFRGEMRDLRKELKEEIRNFKTDMRWAVGIMIGLLITLIIKTFFP